MKKIKILKSEEKADMLGNQDPRMTVVKSLAYHSAAYVLALELKKPSIEKCQQAQTKKYQQ